MQNQNPLDNRNLLLAIVLSAAVLLGFDLMFGPLHKQAPAAAVVAEAPAEALTPTMPQATAAAPLAMVAPAAVTSPLSVNLPQVDFSIAPLGGKLEALTLKEFQQAVDDTTPVQVLRPDGKEARYLDLGWLANGLNAPSTNTPWTVVQHNNTTTVLAWSNGAQDFTRTFTYNPTTYVFNVVDQVTNRGPSPVQLSHYAQLVKSGGDEPGSSWYNFHGPQGFLNSEHHIFNPSDLRDEGPKEIAATGGWVGLSTRYFMAAILPSPELKHSAMFRFVPNGESGFTTVSLRGEPVVVNPGGSQSMTTQVFVGPMSHAALNNAGQGLIHAIDYGWFHVIAQFFFDVLHWFQAHLGNWGVAIIVVTVLLKLLTYPLANASYIAMGKLRLLTPEIERIRDRYKDNREQMALAMMELYKKHQVSPASGCWPILIQIPIFFAFYKVILISFEFRQAPFFGWIQDLSEKDPYFVLPVLMGITMIIQQRLNPPVADPVQQKVMNWMPVIFSIFFLWLPSGLVLYWFVNNLLSILQQGFINRKMEKMGLKAAKGK